PSARPRESSRRTRKRRGATSSGATPSSPSAPISGCSRAARIRSRQSSRNRSRNMAGRLQGKRAIVTGAGSGIGRASAILFAAEGARVLAVDKTKDAVEETAALVAKNGHKAIALAADAGDEADVDKYVKLAVSEFGGLDVIYANAGISG